MYTLPEVRKILEYKGIEEIAEDVFYIGDRWAILTGKGVYVGRNYTPAIADTKSLKSKKFRDAFNEVEENVYESRESPGPAAIRIGNRLHIFPDGWEKTSRKRFVKSLNHLGLPQSTPHLYKLPFVEMAPHYVQTNRHARDLAARD
jgi:hypothetical protein